MESLLLWVWKLAARIEHWCANDITFEHVSTFGAAVGTFLAKFPLLENCLFSLWFYYNIILVSNKLIGWYLMKL